MTGVQTCALPISIRLDRRLAEFGLYWMEESCAAEYPDELALIRRQIGVPVVIGEATYTKTGFRPLLEKRAADILNPDVACVGGILELKEIAAMAELVARAGVGFAAITIAPGPDMIAGRPFSHWPKVPPLGDLYDAARAS